MSCRSRRSPIAPTLLGCLLLPAAAAAQGPVPAGSDLQIPATTLGYQRYPAVVFAPGGGSFLVVWEQNGPAGIFARRRASDGAPLGGEVQVSTGLALAPTVSAAPGGGFVVVWTDASGLDGDGLGVRGRRLDSSGTPVGTELQVNAHTTGHQREPAVSHAPDGTFVVVWEDADDGSGTGVRSRRFDAGGGPLASELLLHTTLSGDQAHGTVAHHSSGAFVVAWEDGGGADGSDAGVFTRAFDAAGAPLGGEAQVHAWTTGDQQRPRLSRAPDGSLVAVWQGHGAGDLDGVAARLLDSTGLPTGADLQLNQTAAGVQGRPVVSHGADGRFVVAWETDDGSGSGIAAGQFAANGSPDGAELLVPVETALDQTWPTIDHGAEGGLVVAWQSYLQDGSADGVFARLLCDDDGDGDGVCDALDVCPLGDDALDDDGDGVADACDLCPGFDDAEDADGDGTPDGCDACPGEDDALDEDGDAVPDGCDVCAFFDDAEDADVDGIPDGCDACPLEGGEPCVAVEEEHLVASHPTGRQIEPAVAAFGDGRFLVAWRQAGSVGDDATGDSIQGRPFGPDPGFDGDQLQLNSITTGDELRPAAAPLPDGGAVLAWHATASSGDDSEATSVQVRRLDAGLVPLGADLQANTVTTLEQRRADVAAAADGSFVAVWESEDAPDDPGSLGVRVRRFAPDGSPLGADFAVNAFTSSDQAAARVAVHPDGSFVVVWQTDASVGDDADTGVHRRRLDAAGTPLGGDLQVHSTTAGAQAAPDVAATPDGGFVVTWESASSAGTDTDGTSIQARRFSSDGTAAGTELQVNAFTPGDQGDPRLAVDGAGRFVVAWAHGDGTSIRTRSFDADGAPRGAEIPVATAPGGGEIVGSPAVAVDPAGDVLVAWVRDTGDERVEARRLRVTGDLGDRAWADADRDGLQGPGEAGIAGLRVDLFDGGSSFVADTTTDADGLFLFPRLPRGDYFLVVERPAARFPAFSPIGAGGDPALDSDVGPDGATALIEVEAGVDDRSRDAGLLPRDLGDRVWLDEDGNGIQDGGEPGVADITVRLHSGIDDALLATTTTDDDGRYGFLLDPGPVYLVIEPPPGFAFTVRDAGDDAHDSDVNAGGTTALLAPPDIDTSVDAGLVPTAAQLGDRVWLDRNGNGLQEGNEPGVPGVTVTLLDLPEPPRRPSRRGGPTAVTDADGYYSFVVEPGTWALAFELPADHAFVPRDLGSDDRFDSDVSATGVTPPIVVPAGGADGTWDAGIEPAEIGDRVWHDGNGDGRQQPGEPGFPGVTVRLLDDADGVVATTTTDASGAYGFLGIADGTWRIEVAAPAGTVFTARDVGGDDLVDSDVDPATGRTASFVYVAGTGSRHHDAGLSIVPLFTDGFESGDTGAWGPP